MPDHAHAPDPLASVPQPDGDIATQAHASTSSPATSAAAHEILAVAVFEPFEGMEAQALATVRELSAVLARGGYSRDTLYREPGGAYVLVRYWKSDEARRHAPEDPDAQRCWARLAHEIQIVKIYERLEEIEV